MDIATGLNAISQAIGIVKSLKELDHSVDVAIHKARIAELYESLADVKITLSDAKHEIHEKDAQIKNLEQEIDSLKNGDLCPICQNGRLKITSSNRHRVLGHLGVQERTLKCNSDGCEHSEKRLYDPSGIINKKG